MNLLADTAVEIHRKAAFTRPVSLLSTCYRI